MAAIRFLCEKLGFWGVLPKNRSAFRPGIDRQASARISLTRDESLEQLQHLQRSARLMMMVEQGAYLLLPAAIAATIAVCFSLLGLFQSMRPALHYGAVVTLFFGIGCNLVAAIRRWPSPDIAAVRRRLECDSGLAHRPVTALMDRPSQDIAITRSASLERQQTAFWGAHLRWALNTIPALKHPRWREMHNPRESFGLLGLLIALMIAAFFHSWGMWSERLESGLNPLPVWLTPFDQIGINLMIEPPAYTGMSPIALKVGKTSGQQWPETIVVPAGSVLKGTVIGDSSPSIKAGRTGFPFLPNYATGNYHIAIPVERTATLTLQDHFRSLASWRVTVVPDQPPTIAFTHSPEITPHGTVKIAYEASDDFGLSSVFATVRLADPDPALKRVYPHDKSVLVLDLPQLKIKNVNTEAFEDLMGSPWAGHKVTIDLTAMDGAGQQTATAPQTLTLPQKVFTNELAREIERARQEFMRDPDGKRESLARLLSNLTIFPEEYQNDGLTLLALRAGATRLELDHADDSLYPISQLVWNIELRLEDQGFSMHESDLRDQINKLASVLDLNSSPAAMEPYLENLRYALNRYINALAQYMQNQLAQSDMDSNSVDGNILALRDSLLMDRDDLAQKFEKLHDLTETGSLAAARDTLSALQKIVEELETRPIAIEHKAGPRNSAADTDPFGRLTSNGPVHDSGQVTVPDSNGASQSRAILNTLRQKVSATPSGQNDNLRSYLLRLLESF